VYIVEFQKQGFPHVQDTQRCYTTHGSRCRPSHLR
jgi:hypothetical protein